MEEFPDERQFNRWAAKYPENFEALASLIDQINLTKVQLGELEDRLLILAEQFKLETRSMSGDL